LKEQFMAWVHQCEKCSISFAAEVEEGAEESETATCPECGTAGAVRQFEIPKSTCGCGSECGSGGCC
jgi:hypothetical protein